MKKSSLQTGPYKIQTFCLLSWTHKMVVHKFSTSKFEATGIKMYLHFCTLASSERCFSSTALIVSKLRARLSGEDLEALNVMYCNKVLL